MVSPGTKLPGGSNNVQMSSLPGSNPASPNLLRSNCNPSFSGGFGWTPTLFSDSGLRWNQRRGSESTALFLKPRSQEGSASTGSPSDSGFRWNQRRGSESSALFLPRQSQNGSVPELSFLHSTLGNFTFQSNEKISPEKNERFDPDQECRQVFFDCAL